MAEYLILLHEDEDEAAAARADLLRQLGRTTQARACYEEALLLTENTTAETGSPP